MKSLEPRVARLESLIFGTEKKGGFTFDWEKQRKLREEELEELLTKGREYNKSNYTVDLFMEHLDEGPEGSFYGYTFPYVFVTQTGRIISYQEALKNIRKISEALSGEKVDREWEILRRILNVDGYPTDIGSQVEMVYSSKIKTSGGGSGVRTDLGSTTEIEVGWSFGVSGESAQDNIGDLIYNEEEILYTWRGQGLIDSEGNITDKGQELLVQDILKVEDGCIKWLKDTFVHAVADGHNSYDDLVGRVWINPKNPDHIKEMSGEFLNSNEFVLHSSSGTLDWSIFEGASEFGQSLLDASLTFYKEGLEDILDR